MAPFEPIYTSCEFGESCSARTPDCRALDPDGDGNHYAYCTRVCDTEGAPCPALEDAYSSLPGLCLGVAPDGKLASTSAEKLCFWPCDDGSVCVLGAGSASENGTICHGFDYGDAGAQFVCVPSGSGPIMVP